MVNKSVKRMTEQAFSMKKAVLLGKATPKTVTLSGGGDQDMKGAAMNDVLRGCHLLFADCFMYKSCVSFNMLDKSITQSGGLCRKKR